MIKQYKISGDIEQIAKIIAGDIVFSKNIGKAIKRWRERFQVSQSELAHKMGISPSVISDYESGRRRSPGASTIRKFVLALIELDIERGMSTISFLERLYLGFEELKDAVLDIREFLEPITIEEFCKIINAELLVGEESKDHLIFGYTVVDSIKVAVEVPAQAYMRLFGNTTQRAAIFTRVMYGRSPLVAVKAFQGGTGLKPALVVIHGPSKVDALGLMIAQKERIPLALSHVKDLESLIKKLRSI